MPTTYTVQEVQDRYKVSLPTILGWIANKELIAINVGREPGKKIPRWRFTEESLLNFEQSRSTEAPAPKRRRKKQDQGVTQYY